MSTVECPPILFPETLNCSARGSCVNANECDCPDGWTGRGDFLFGAPSCAVNILAIRILWGLTATFSGLVGILGIVGIAKRLKSQTRSKQNRFTGAPLILEISVTLYALFLTLTASMRSAFPDSRTIGTDPFVTICFVLGAALFWASAKIYVFITVRVPLGQAQFLDVRTRDRLILWTKISFTLFSVVPLVGCLSLLGMLAGSSGSDFAMFSTIHYFLLGIELPLTAVELSVFVSIVRNMLERVHDSTDGRTNRIYQKANKALKKMELFRAQLYPQMIVNFSISMVFAFWPLVQVYGASYQVPLAWTSAASLAGHALYTVAVQQTASARSTVQDDTGDDGGGATDGKRPENVQAMSSVYIQSATELADLPRLEPCTPRKRSTIAELGRSAEQRVLIVGHDSIVSYWLSERMAFRLTFTTTQPLMKIFLLNMCICVECLDTLVLVGVLPPIVSAVSGGVVLFITGLMGVTWLSVSIVRKLLRRQTILLRIFFWCLYLIFYDIVMQDERIVMGVAHSLLILLAVFSDAFVKEVSGYFGFAINCAACLLLMKRFILLQFDLIQPRYNDRVYIVGNMLVWSVYQAARDFGSALLALLLKDLIRQFQNARTSVLVHIQSGVIVRIIGLATECKMELANSKIMKKFGGIGLSSRTMAHTLKSSNIIKGGVLTLRERDALAIRWFGRTRGEWLLKFLGRPWVRWISRSILASCLFTYICLILPGVLPPWASLFMLLTLFPSIRALLLKNWALIRALVEQVDFAIEAIFALAVLGIFGAMLRDARIAALPMLFIMWLDFRLSDAQCVFYHSKHRGETYQSSKGFFWGHALFTMLLVLSLLVFPMILVMQLVTNVDSNLGFNLRGIDVNMTSPVLDERYGAYAQVRLYQYVSDFLLTFAVIATIDLVVDVIRKPKSQVSLKYFRAPVKKICSEGFASKGSLTDERNSPALTTVPTVFFSEENGEDAEQEESSDE